MAITINGTANTVAGIAAGGINDNVVDNGTMANNAIDSAELAAGAVDLAHLSATGTASSSTFLRGDNAWAAAGGGKVLQIVQATHSTAVTDTSGSYTDTGLTANITTSSAHAGVLVIINPAMGATANNGGDAYVKFNIVRDSTQLREGMCGGWQDNLSGHTHVMYWQPAMNYYDTGTSASTTYTYKCQFKKDSDAVNAFAQNSTQGASYIHLVEIGS